MSIVRFGDVVKDIKLNVDRSNNPYEHYIAGDHMDTEDLTLRRKGAFATDDVGPAFIRIFKPGQVLYGSRRTYLKKVAVADFKGVTANTTFVFETVDDDVLSQKLLPFLMLSEEFTKWSIKKSKGSTNPYVLFSDLADYEFELPSITQQRVLAEKLWAAYNLKEAYKKMNSAIDEMVKSQFIELISRSAEWKSLNEITTYIGKGITPKYVDHSNIAVINQACVYWTGLQPEHVKFHDVSVVLKKAYLEDLDILLNSTGRGTLGRSCLFVNPKDGRLYITDGHVSVIKVDRNIILPEVLVAYFSLTDVQNEIYRQYVTGSTNQIDIVFSEIRKMIVPIPNIEEQKQFIEIAKQADKSKFELKQAIDKIEKVMKSLLQ